jgi:site-specific recombinase
MRHALFDAMRSRDPRDAVRARSAFAMLLALLESRDDYRVAVRDALIGLFESRREVSFFTDAGILPSSGFFSELSRRIGNHVLPAVPDRTSFKDCVRLVFHEPDDDVWLHQIRAEERARLWMLLALHEGADRAKRDGLTLALLEAMQILATRIAALGVEPELVQS